MDFEFATDFLLRGFFGRHDQDKSAVVLEIGLGSGNFSFEWAAPLGYRCIAVEPLPTESLFLSQLRHNSEIVVAAVGSKSGQCKIYHGSLNGHDLPDISSLNPNWWGVSNRSTLVPLVTLPQLCFDHSVESIALLKVDTEGSEPDVLGLLSQLDSHRLPRFITIEYGGGGRFKSEGRGGWSNEFFNGTCELLKITRDLGYCATIVLEVNRLFPNLREGRNAFDPGVLFANDFLVGNIIFIRDSQDSIRLSGIIGSSRGRFILVEMIGLYKRCAQQLRHLVFRVTSKLKRSLCG